MWGMQLNTIYNDARPLHNVCKFLGLAPYSIRINPLTGEGFIDTDFKSNTLTVIWTLILLCAMVGGLIDTIIMNVMTFNFSTSDIINKAFCLPMFYMVSILMIVMNGTVNKYKIEQFLSKISEIDKVMSYMKGQEYSKIKSKKYSSYFEIAVLIAVFLPCLIYDVCSFMGDVIILCKIQMRLCEILQFVLMTQHCQLTRFIRVRLKMLGRVVSAVFNDSCSEGESELPGSTREAFNSKLSTGVTRISPELVSNKKLLAYKIFHLSEANTVDLFSCNAKNFARLRRVYSLLCDAVGFVNSIYGFLVMFLIMQIFIELITGVNGIMHLIKENNSPHFANATLLIVHLISRIVLSLGILVTTILSCHVTVLESKELGIYVQKILLKYPLRSDTVQQLKLFYQQISNNDIQFTAFWLFNLDISFLCTIFASSITYIILLAQIK
ncbi:hypothetical protein L798_12325 [Zootermopsis nevadensis]|uniref:Gustatory receptor n=1 Tax=Zootermopsis nevadensis TaxID=136037 RepID=A0A067QWN2_ZOONE|nr:hypothetical protein L798_12325 [Zootermopsis nevadensis]